MKKGGRWLIVLAAAAVVVFLFLAGPNGLIRLVRMKQREQRLQQQIVELKTEIELTQQKLERMATDPEFLRQVAKQKLEMIDTSDTSGSRAPLEKEESPATKDGG